LITQGASLEIDATVSGDAKAAGVAWTLAPSAGAGSANDQHHPPRRSISRQPASAVR